MRVFISYRREDGALSARLIHEKLANRFGASAVFLDATDITPGDSFPERIARNLADAEVVVAVLGPRWPDLLRSRAPDGDYVRIELSEARRAEKRIIPVLVEGADASSFAAAPSDFAWLTKLNAIELTPRALDADLQRLVDAVRGRRFEDIEDEQRHRKRARTIGVAIAFVAFLAAWTSVLDLFALEARIDGLALGVLGALDPRALDPRVAQIAIDRTTEAAIGREYDLSWRREYARLIDRLVEARVRTIAFDVSFERETADDAALASAIRRARAAGVDVVLAASGIEAGRPRIARVIADAASGWGLSCAGTKLGSVGAMLISATHGAAEPKEHWPSLALAAAFPGRPVVAVDARRREIRLGGGQQERAVRFSREENVVRGGACGTNPGDKLVLGVLAVPRIGALRDAGHLVPFERVLTLDPRELALDGKIVLVGRHFEGDVHRTALRGERYGIELHLVELGILLEDATPQAPGVIGQLANMCAIALVAVGLEGRRSRWGRARVSATLAAAFVSYLACAVFFYWSERVLLNLAASLGAFAAAWWAAARVRRIGESA